ncbi:MAG TPA: type I-C CRISPR-associated protein Cas8c/Csd1 [Oligella sp.]|nr:type I-C CRISPR-associated protein Cas8c/Csd1 [Oligella sp.]
MSWLQQLYKTYEYASQRDEDIQAQDIHTLMPYYHVNQNIQVIVTINDKGDFVSAELCRDDNGKVKSHNLVIPATNESANRTAGAVAHPLADKLQYVAKDFFAYSNNKKDLYPLYEEILTAWCESKSAHPKAKAILTYTQKGTLVKDLINAGVLIVNPENKSKLAYPSQASDYSDSLLSSLNKNKGVFDQGSAFIAWRVTPTDLSKQSNWGNIDTWQDTNLFEAWQRFYATLDSVYGFCYITGQYSPLASKHPNRILRGATNAKLISANDLSGFTFLGRFNDNDNSIKASGLQGANISSVVTEKAHAALSWLLARQGKEEAGQAVVAWAISGSNILQPTQEIREINTFSVVNNYQATNFNEISDTDNQTFDNLFEIEADDKFEILDDSEAFLDNHEPEHKLDHKNDLGFSFAKHLTNTLHGYRQRLDKHDQVSIIVLDSATTGRMAVTYYHESLPDDYIQAIESWYRQFSWYSRYKDPETNEYKQTISAPIPKKIAEVAYGLRLSDALKKQVISQVLPCIVEGNTRQIPWQLVDLCYKRACNPMALEHWEWEQSLSVACSLYRGYYLRQSKNKQRSYTVALQTDYNSRDYLYGRLLAVAEDIESLALYIAGENRNTTAERYMQQFANRPFTTWRNIELALKPYENRLKNNRGGYLKKMQDLLDQIMNTFDVADFNNDLALSGEFLLGYHSQKMQLKLDKQLVTKSPH